MKKRRRCCRNVCVLFLGILLTSLGITIFLYFGSVYEIIIKSALEFNPESKAYKVWRINDPPLIMDIYMFNWTNPQDIYTKGVKPRFQEVGPFRFKEIKEKINVTWNENNTVTYRQRKLFYFHEDESTMPLSTEITTINAVAMTAAFRARHWGFFWKNSVSLALRTFSALNITKPASELLFDGYEDDFLSVVSALPITDEEGKFGFFYRKNNTVGTDGVFTMSFAHDENFGKLTSWNYGNRTEFYEGHCGDIRGSAGEFYPINRGKDRIELYSAELCKNAILEFEEEVDVKGVKGYKYSARNLFDNGTLKPENACFCGGECIPSGVLNVSSCRQNSPSFLSLPHFYDADPFYVNSIEGLHPEKRKHEFYISLEPKSGIIVDIAARMQLNMLLQPIEDIALFENVPKLVFPIFYFTQEVPMTDELASSLRLLQNLPHIGHIVSLVFTSVGSLLILWVCLSYICCRIRNYDNEYKVPHNTHEEVPLGTWNGAAAVIQN